MAKFATRTLPLIPTAALPVLAPTRVEVTTPAQAVGDPGRTWRFLIAVVDESNAPGLTVRPLAQLDPQDPLAGHELWYPLTDTVVVAGLRETGAATRLLQLLETGSLTRIRMRMDTPATRSTGAAETLGTVCGLSTLACWPQQQRAELVAAVAEAAEAALQGHPTEPRPAEGRSTEGRSTEGRSTEGRSGGTATALRWVRSLARDYPDDPLVLAPLLLQLRMIRPGKTYVIPPGWAFAHLRGTAIRIVAADTPVQGGGLGASDIDRGAFATALTAGHAGPPAEPSAQALAQATELAERVASQHRLMSTPES